MNYSGILVMARPQNIPDVSIALNSLEGVEVFQQEPETGRIVAVLEAESIKAETDMLQTIKALPGVAAAEMVYHYFEDDQEILTHIPEELDKLQGLGTVPEALQDN
ncbi:MAG: chaperone NapD [Hydrogenophilaceae bacterium]|nr:chaperone NapD [Hydrogenophilaceae bacterium]